MNRLKNKKEKN